MNNVELIPPERNVLPKPPLRWTKADELDGPSRYELLVKIGSGGMASVYVGRLSGSAGFSRFVAVKRAHSFVLQDPAGERMLSTEARLSSKLNHANVVAVQDVERTSGELLLIMDYIEGSSLAELIEAGAAVGQPMPARVAVRIMLDACAGLAAAHDLEHEDGRPMGFLHRDVSPHNILVGIDGTARLSDFGLAKALASSGYARSTNCSLKGKLAYLAPEIIDQAVFSVKSDLFAMGVVTWEALARRRLFRGDSEADTIRKVGLMTPPLLSRVVPELGDHLDKVIRKALAKDPEQRYGAVRELAAALEGAARRADLIATSAEVGAYVRQVVGAELHRRRERIRGLEQRTNAGDLKATLPMRPEDVMPKMPQEASIELSSRDLLPVEAKPAKATERPRQDARRWGAGAAFAAILCGSALAAGVFFAKPWTPGAGHRVAALWNKVGIAHAAASPPPPVTVVTPEPKRVEGPKVVASPAPPPAKAEEKAPAVLKVSAPPDTREASKPAVLKISDLPDTQAGTESGSKPAVINVSALPDKDSESRPTVINVSDLPDKYAAEKPTVISVSSLPDK